MGLNKQPLNFRPFAFPSEQRRYVECDLKLSCRNIYCRHIFIWKIYLSAPIILDELHAWFHLYCLRRAVSNGKLSKNSKWEYTPRPGIKPTTPCFPVCRSNHSAIGTFNDILLKLLQYVFTLLSINTIGNACKKLIFVICVLDLTVIQNLHFFYQYRFLQKIVWTNHSIINFILTLSHVLSDSSVNVV